MTSKTATAQTKANGFIQRKPYAAGQMALRKPSDGQTDSSVSPKVLQRQLGNRGTQGWVIEQRQMDVSSSPLSSDYIMRTPFEGEDRTLYERRIRILALIPRVTHRVEDALRRGYGGLFSFERNQAANGLIFSGGPDSDWPPETLSERRRRLLTFLQELREICNELKHGQIPSQWVSSLRSEEMLEQQEHSAGLPENRGSVSGFGAVVEDLMLIYFQYANDQGNDENMAMMNVLYIEGFTESRARSPTPQPSGIEIIVPDPNQPTRVIRITGRSLSGLLDQQVINPLTGELIPPDADIIPVIRDSRGFFYRSSQGRVDLENIP